MNMPRSTKPFCRDLLTKSQGTEISEMRYISLSLSLSHFFFYLKISWPLACSYFWRVFWLNIVKNEVYLWYEYCSNLFGEMGREANFSNTIIEILWKSRKKERQMMWWMWKKKRNFGNDTAKKKKNWIVAIELPKLED